MIRSYGFRCHDEVHIASFLDTNLMNSFNKFEKNRLFIELKKQEKTFIVIDKIDKKKIYFYNFLIRWLQLNQKMNLVISKTN